MRYIFAYICTGVGATERRNLLISNRCMNLIRSMIIHIHIQANTEAINTADRAQTMHLMMTLWLTH